MELVSTILDLIKSFASGHYYITGAIVVYSALAFFPKDKRELLGAKLAYLIIIPFYKIFKTKLGPRDGKKITRALLCVLDDVTNGFVVKAEEILKNETNGGC